MDPSIDAYIRENRERYTPEAIRERLVAAGHDPAEVDAAWARATGWSAVQPPRPIGWRPGWREFLVLAILGTVGAAIVWAGEMYGGGGIAPVVYLILVSVGFAVGKGLSTMVDAGSTVAAAVVLAVVALGAVAMFNSAWGVALAVVPAVAALLLLYFRRRSPGRARMVGAAIPILVWLVVTGTCLSPILTS